MRPRSDEVRFARMEQAKAGRQRCLCGHPRRTHTYQPGFRLPHRAPRECRVQGCTCPNFILVQRSIL